MRYACCKILFWFMLKSHYIYGEIKVEIKNVIFDFGGVLLDWNPRYLYNDVFNDKEKMEYFLEHICSSTWNAQMDKGVPFKDAVARLQEQYPEYKEEIALYETGWPKMLKGEIADGIDIFNKVEEVGRFRIYGLTNWSAETFPVAFSRYRFLDDFEGIVVSGEEEMIKPEKVSIIHCLSAIILSLRNVSLSMTVWPMSIWPILLASMPCTVSILSL